MNKFEGLYLAEYEIDRDKNKPIIWLFQRLINGTKKVTKVENFKPYFYIDSNMSIPGKQDEEYNSIFGDKLKKVIVNSPRDIYELRKHIEEKGFKHYEADILYNNRFLIDEVEEIIPSNYRKFYLDIETLSEGGFPDVNTTQQPIICITNYDSFSKKYVTWIWRNDFDENVEKNGLYEVKKFKTEKEMLQSFINYIHKEMPDVIMGWNVVNFDIKYLINRMKNIFNLPTYKMSPMKSVFISKGYGKNNDDVYYDFPIIKGIVLFDLLSYYRKVHKGELSSYSLNNVAIEELGEQKTNTHHVVDKDWKGEWKNVLNYNIKDVELTVKIDEKVGVFSFFDQMRTISHVNIDDCKYYGRVVDSFILRYAKQNNIILPTKKPYNPDRVLEGGYVMEPVIGLHNNVIVLDLNSIYPSLIETFNLSAETKVDDGEINIQGIRFTKKIKGIIPSILTELGSLRVEFKKRMKELRYNSPEFKVFDAKQQAAKNLACTVYGLNALSTFRLNNDYVAQTITYLGRSLVTWVREKSLEKGYSTVYSDTDSCFIKLPDNLTTDECIEKGKELANVINENLGDFALQFGVKEHSLSLDFEKCYKKLLMVAKKRYAGHVVYKDGDYDDAIQIVGLEVKRSDSSKVSRNMQEEIIKMILKNESKEKVVNFIEDIIYNIRTRTFSDVAIPVKFEKPLEGYNTNIPRVRGAKLANNLFGTNYNAGSKVLMLYTKGEQDCICFEDDSQIENIPMKIDYSKMIEKTIIMKVDKIFEVLGWQKDIDRMNIRNINTNNKLITDFF